MSSDCEYRIQKQNSLVSPFLQVSIIRDIAAQIIVKLLVDILQGWWNILLRRKHRKRQSVRLIDIVVRVLSEDEHLYLVKRCKVHGIKYVICRRIYHMCGIFISHKIVQIPVIRFFKLGSHSLCPLTVKHTHNIIYHLSSDRHTFICQIIL